MLLLKSDTSQNTEGSELYIEVENATGLYDAETNDGGFGAPNAARNEVALIIVAKHILSAGDEDATVSEYDPLTVESFTVAVTRLLNGVLHYLLYAIPIYDTGGVYEAGDIVYDKEDPFLPFIKEMNEALERVTITTEDLLGKTGVNESTKHAFIAPDAIAFRNRLNADRTRVNRQKVAGLCGEEDYEAAKLNFDYVDGELECALNDFCDTAYAEAQIKVEAILELENNLNA